MDLGDVWRNFEIDDIVAQLFGLLYLGTASVPSITAVFIVFSGLSLYLGTSQWFTFGVHYVEAFSVSASMISINYEG